jgi:hypothetical protein
MKNWIEHNKDFLVKRAKEYPHAAEAPTGLVRPHEYKPEVRQCSSVVEPGWRVWLFAEKSDRDAFLAEYPEARLTDDPHHVTGIE